MSGLFNQLQKIQRSMLEQSVQDDLTQLAQKVSQVNGVKPDASGNVTISVGGGSASTANVYEIELSRWGITQGLPSKTGSPAVYQTTDYTNAYNNMMGINNAINWAASQNYNYVILPKGNYAVCYANISSTVSQNRIIIQAVNNMVIDFNDSTFKVLYDSDFRQPYDKVLSGGSWVTNTAPTYQFSGTIMQIMGCNYVTVKNLILIGDKIDRSFSNVNEQDLDITNGVNIGDGCQFCSLENVDSSFFMADGLTSGGGNYSFPQYTTANPNTGYSMKWAIGALDVSGNLLGSDTTHCVSDYISVTGDTPYFIQGYGYTQGMTDLVTKHYQIFCYDSSKTFITQLSDTYVLRSFTTPKNCAYVRFVVYESSLPGTMDTETFNFGGTATTAGTITVSLYDTYGTKYDFTYSVSNGASASTVASGVNSITGGYSAAAYKSSVSGSTVTFTGTSMSSRTKATISWGTVTGLTCSITQTAFNSNGWEMSLKPGYLGHFITIKDCYIHHNARGGLSIGVNDMFIENNRFYNNGVAYDYENNLPGFGTQASPSSTRYHINMEDSWAYNINIIGNTFIGGYMGIAFRGWNFTIRDNMFMNLGNALEFYDIRYALVDGNTFQNAGISSYGYNVSDNKIRDWHFTNNTVDGYFNIVGTATIDTISGNVFLQQITLPCFVRTFANNTIRMDNDIMYNSYVSFIQGQVVESCNFIKGTTNQNSMTLTGTTFIDCNLTNIKVTATNCTLKNSVITDCGFTAIGSILFDGCTVNKTGVSLNNKYSLGYDNSSFVLVSSDGCTITVKNCTITDANTDDTFGSDNSTYSYVTNVNIINSTITKNSGNKLGFDRVKGSLLFDNATIINNGSTVTYTPSMLFRHQYKDSIFTNLTFTMKASDIYYSQKDIGQFASSIPTAGSFNLGNKIWNTSPVASGSLGWICTTGGTANNSSWASATDYTVTTSHNGTTPYVAPQINNGTNVYQALSTGHSAFTTPTFPSTIGNRIDDVAGVGVWAASTPYSVGNAVIPLLETTAPTTAPTLSLVANANSTLVTATTTLWVQYTWVTPTGETTGKEGSISVTTGNNLSISVPAFPSGVTKVNIYVGTASGQETFQGSITTSGNSYVISAPISTNGVYTPLTSSNGYWYECTVAGTSGVTAPTWSKTANATFADGSVTWKAHPIVTWKNIDNLAVIKTFGTISA